MWCVRECVYIVCECTRARAHICASVSFYVRSVYILTIYIYIRSRVPDVTFQSAPTFYDS